MEGTVENKAGLDSFNSTGQNCSGCMCHEQEVQRPKGAMWSTDSQRCLSKQSKSGYPKDEPRFSIALVDFETRSYMKKVADRFPYGVAECARQDESGLAYGHIFFDMSSGMPNEAMTFAPGFIDSPGRGDQVDTFKKISNLGVSTEIEKMDSFPYCGTRSQLEHTVIKGRTGTVSIPFE